MNHSAWLQTYSGRKLDLLEPTSEQINIRDIAIGLSRTPRWSGQTKHFLSVAQHSLMVSENVPKTHALIALLHNGSESYLADIPAPLKDICTDYRNVERRVQATIYARFITPPTSTLVYGVKVVREADLRVCATEYRDLHPHKLFTPLYAPYDWEINYCMNPAEAELAFLERFHELRGEHHG